MTALQEMFAKMEDQQGLYETWEWLVLNKETFIEKERQQIEDAYITARAEFDKVPSRTVESAEDYYNKTYSK